ncbi:AraC family transcriptional regulator [Cypionkella sinensis]|uniref:Helix-turn-helix domain-containing protein n=1 Tax=Cypionkella sinensis TaxID=1756043 RepID=A0ABV7IZE4_9RHOB
MSKHIAETPNQAPSAIGYQQDPARPILAHGRTMPPQDGIAPHRHPRAQLLWATAGVLRVTAGAETWIVPTSHAVWVPADVPHAVQTETEVQIRNLYIDASRPLRPGNRTCAVLSLSDLMRALILRLHTESTATAYSPRLLRLCDVIADEIEALHEAPLHLPGGQDRRLVRLTRHLMNHPDDATTLPDLARSAATSPRTLERLFRQETGLSYRQWRARQRLLLAIERLTRGESSATIAYALGYGSPSAFTAAFRAAFGTPPQSFLKTTSPA